MDAQVKNWLDSARYDLDTAAEMSQAGRYPYVIFSATWPWKRR